MQLRRVGRVVAAAAVVCGCSANNPPQTPETLDAGATPPDTAAADAAADANSDGMAGRAEPVGGAVAGAGGAGGAADGASGAQSNAGSAASAGAGGREAVAGAGGRAGAEAEDPVPSYVELEAEVSVIAASALAQPSDLAFNPYGDDELWIVNHGDSSATIIHNASQSTRSVEARKDPEGARHFMPEPTGLAFGARETSIVDAAGKMVEGTFATCPEAADSFMGPTLWTSDLRIFAISKADREPPFNGDDTGAEGPGSHIDMLHRTPTCTGIAWEGSGNIYWTYSGANAQLVRYDFGKDHGIGNDDHSDGAQWRYAIDGIRYVPGIPSHLAWDPARKRLLVADTGNSRVVAFDPSSATDQAPMSEGENVDKLQIALDMSGGAVEDFVPRDYGLLLPSGVEIHGQMVYVSDHETSTIHRFGLDGTPLGKLSVKDLPTRSLAGIAFGQDGKLYFVDIAGSRVLRSETTF